MAAPADFDCLFIQEAAFFGSNQLSIDLILVHISHLTLGYTPIHVNSI